MSNFSSFITIFFIILLGIFCYRRKVFNGEHIAGLELFLLKITLPLYLFSTTYKADLQKLFEVKYIVAYFLTFAVLAVLIAGILYIKKMPISSILIRILASTYVNAAIYTLPIITILLNNPISGIIGNILQVVIIQPVFITLLSFIQHKDKSLIKKVFNIVTTPIIIMPVLGMIFNHFQVILPPSIVNAVSSIGIGAFGIALFTFGLTLGSTKITKECLRVDLLGIIFAKNLLQPIIAILIAYFMKLDSYWANSLLIASSAPTAFVVYIISKQFSTDEELVKKSIALSSIFSTITLLLIITLIKN